MHHLFPLRNYGSIRRAAARHGAIPAAHVRLSAGRLRVPHNMDMTDKEVKKAINDMVKEKYPTYYCVITIDKSYAAMPH